MTTVRSAKVKGSAFEYDCQYSLSKIFPEIWRTSERGFQLQYDLETNMTVFECKRLKGMSWNQATKFFTKLENVAPMTKGCQLLFKSNQQPCLVMYRDENKDLVVKTFESFYRIPFLKHPSTRKNNSEK